MKRIAISGALFSIALITSAQISPTKDVSKHSTSIATKEDSLNAVLFVMNGFPISKKYFNSIPDKIESMHLLKGHDAIALYGDKAKNGAIVITLKPQYKDEILKVPAEELR